MDIYNLETFIEVAESKSFSRSAVALSLTQPAISKRIAALESELSSKLFDRLGRTVTLTEAGRLLLPSARQICNELRRAEAAIGGIGIEVGGKLAIATTDFVAVQHLPPILSRYRTLFPSVNVDISFGSSKDVINNVEENLVDLCFCTLPTSAIDSNSGDLPCFTLLSYNLQVMVANHHPLASIEKVTAEDLSSSAVILPSSDPVARAAFHQQLNLHGITPQTVHEAESHSAMTTKASIGLGWAWLPDINTETNSGFVIDSSMKALGVTELQIPYSVVIISNQELTRSSAAQEFLQALQQD